MAKREQVPYLCEGCPGKGDTSVDYDAQQIDNKHALCYCGRTAPRFGPSGASRGILIL